MLETVPKSNVKNIKVKRMCEVKIQRTKGKMKKKNVDFSNLTISSVAVKVSYFTLLGIAKYLSNR